ncbi:MAG: LacI family DNA-binding transcriptional regulator [Capsulimonadales bacterium]|nr:LacI family DNA-binding transcriptional regulator [Capsulimonadales bacterium]
MRATIKQIAEKTGLSVPTVSRILSDKGAAHQESTRERVLAAARELGYRPNSSARAMRRGRFDTITLLRSATDAARSQLPAELLAGIQEALHRAEIRLSIASLPDPQLTDPGFMPIILREWASDGLLINYNAAIPNELIRLIAEYSIPAIWINSRHSADCIFPDDEAAAADATRHLITLGHRRIAYVDFQESGHYSAAERRNGYEAAMAEAGLSPRKIVGQYIPERLGTVPSEVDERFGGDWPTALLTYGAHTMRPILIAALARGRRIPEDLSVIDITAHNRETISVPVDSMVLPQLEIGRRAVEMLLDKIADGRSFAPCPIPFGRSFGATSGPPPERVSSVGGDDSSPDVA